MCNRPCCPQPKTAASIFQPSPLAEDGALTPGGLLASLTEETLIRDPLRLSATFSRAFRDVHAGPASVPGVRAERASRWLEYAEAGCVKNILADVNSSTASWRRTSQGARLASHGRLRPRKGSANSPKRSRCETATDTPAIEATDLVRKLRRCIWVVLSARGLPLISLGETLVSSVAA